MRPGRKTITAAVLAVGLTTGGALYTTNQASADDTPTSLELLQRCNNGADYCVFHPSGDPQLFASDVHQIGTTLYNCGPGDATKTAAWSDSTGESNSLGVSLTTSAGVGLEGVLTVFKVEREISYGHTWGTTDTTRRSTDVKVAAGQKAWLTRQAPMQRVGGTYELHFGSRFHGHYYWYVPFTMTGPAPDAHDVDVVAQHSGPMSDEEKTQCA
jgi:hypothetical protein